MQFDEATAKVLSPHVRLGPRARMWSGKGLQSGRILWPVWLHAVSVSATHAGGGPNLLQEAVEHLYRAGVRSDEQIASYLQLRPSLVRRLLTQISAQDSLRQVPDPQVPASESIVYLLQDARSGDFIPRAVGSSLPSAATELGDSRRWRVFPRSTLKKSQRARVVRSDRQLELPSLTAGPAEDFLARYRRQLRMVGHMPEPALDQVELRIAVLDRAPVAWLTPLELVPDEDRRDWTVWDPFVQNSSEDWKRRVERASEQINWLVEQISRTTELNRAPSAEAVQLAEEDLGSKFPGFDQLDRDDVFQLIVERLARSIDRSGSGVTVAGVDTELVARVVEAVLGRVLEGWRPGSAGRELLSEDDVPRELTRRLTARVGHPVALPAGLGRFNKRNVESCLGARFEGSRPAQGLHACLVAGLVGAAVFGEHPLHRELAEGLNGLRDAEDFRSLRNEFRYGTEDPGQPALSRAADRALEFAVRTLVETHRLRRIADGQGKEQEKEQAQEPEQTG